MPAQMFYDADADLDLIKDKKIAVIGFGSQGHAHALNLRDSGCDVIVGLYPGSRSWTKVQDSGLQVDTVADAAAAADIVMVLTPDHVQKSIYDQHIAPTMTEGKTLMFAHGFAIHFNQVMPPPEVDVTMIAPKGPGHLVRRVFEEGGGVPALLVSGAEDHVGAPPDVMQAMADAMPDARHVSLPGAGHICTVANPGAFDDAMTAFLNEIQG